MEIPLIEGKTKRIIPTSDGLVVLETKDELTGGDAAIKASIQGIAVHKTTQAAHVFQYLQSQGIPTAFVKRHGDKSLLCQDCEMLPLELVTRRFAWGSYLKRNPDAVRPQGQPLRFDTVQWEIFHKQAVVTPPLVPKTIQMDEGAARTAYLKNGVWAKEVYTDPFVVIEKEGWHLHPAKVPYSAINSLICIAAPMNTQELDEVVQRLMIPCFLALEKAWAKIETQAGPVALADLKIEVGRVRKSGQLLIADVVDNDSWRIWPGANPALQLDKQNFRDGHPLSEVADNYKLVAELTHSFSK